MSSPQSSGPTLFSSVHGGRSWLYWTLVGAFWVVVAGIYIRLVSRYSLDHPVAKAFSITFVVILGLMGILQVVKFLGGPMFMYDLFRTGRKGLGIGHRFLYGGFLLLALFLLYSSWFPYGTLGQLFDDVRMAPDQMPRFAASFFGTFLVVQVATVLIVTPAYVAGSIAEEKQRRTLEFVLTTDLSNREVVLGVLGARLANLALLLMTGLPVLSLLQFLGGVDPLMVFTGFAVTFFTMFSLAGQSMLASVLSRRPLDSIVGTYFVAFFTELVPAVIVLSAMVGSWERFSQPLDCLALLMVCAIFHGGIGLGCCALAITSLRTAYLGTELPPVAAPPLRIVERRVEANPQELTKRKGAMRAVLLGEEIDGVPVVIPVEAVAMPEQARAAPSRGWSPSDAAELDDEATASDPPRRWPAPPPPPPLRPPPVVNFDYPFRVRPPCGDEPVLWKETGRNFDFSFLSAAHLRWVATIIAIIYAFIFVVSMAMNAVTSGEGPSTISNPMVRVLGTIGACVTLVLLALAGANKISREKEQQTLEGLLTTPLDSVEILFGKWLATVWTVSPIMFILLLVWGMGVMTGGIHPASLPLLLAAYLVYVCCLSTLGLWLSMASRTTLRATLFSLLASMVLVMGPGLLMRAIDGRSARSIHDLPVWYDLIMEYGFTPPLTLCTLTFHGDALQGDPYAMLRIVGALLGLLVYIFVTAAMWASMLQRLRGSVLDAPRSEGGGG